MNKIGKRRTGIYGEDVACHYLASKDYLILERNFRCRNGEIDVIAMKGDVLVFVEVKTRRNLMYGVAAAAVTKKKLLHIYNTIKYYLSTHPKFRRLYKRVDVIEVYLDDAFNAKINHIENITM